MGCAWYAGLCHDVVVNIFLSLKQNTKGILASFCLQLYQSKGIEGQTKHNNRSYVQERSGTDLKNTCNMLVLVQRKKFNFFDVTFVTFTKS